ncbi:unnamed protein product (macronuclear) [Paramecium tetraurelia]|uniref:Uncharacterized protein n=1 Tax=Paramecium tetraurelia TaxID=5888 RepID=A0DIU4_PARTE|nr:uncharacterized protein GSPATT00017318001 [Paramecium tetraurelia]CAK82961.1 unnamed protein product [Paramecium tetraurelia]|eukprot:XP_001450358.1 hypothetical protein (macronuclear) [Paramecium tetraurelia strain d4-2]
MKILLFALSIILISGNECSLKKQTCKDQKTKQQCIGTDWKASWCRWEDSCFTYSYASCYYSFSEQECLERPDNECYWQNGECLTNEVKCENIKTYEKCSHISKGYTVSCTWKYGRCLNVEKCSEITDFKQCRNAYMKDRCQYVINNVASDKEKEYIFAADIFDYNSCRNEDCVFSIHSDCPEFRNGRRCFLKSELCTQCSYQTNAFDCISTQKCTWQNHECSNILCSQITSKRLCNEFSYCQYDFTTQSCQIKNNDKKSHCYNYNIRSDPVKTKYNSFFGL